jgi:hypothetical protein
MTTNAVWRPILSLTTIHGIDVGAGTPASWAVPNIDAFNNQFHIWDQTQFPAGAGQCAPPCNVAPGCSAFLQGPGQFLSQNGIIHENDIGFWIQGDWNAEFYGGPSAAISAAAMSRPPGFDRLQLRSRHQVDHHQQAVAHLSRLPAVDECGAGDRRTIS